MTADTPSAVLAEDPICTANDGRERESDVRAIADASEITGLPRDNFEAHEISEEAFKEVGSR